MKGKDLINSKDSWSAFWKKYMDLEPFLNYAPN